MNNTSLKFEFRVTPGQRNKPGFPLDFKPLAPSSSNGVLNGHTPHPEEEGKARGYKSDIDDGKPAWHVAHIHGPAGPTHRIIYNKYCIYRPQYILMTASASHLQTTPLDLDDLRAGWTMLNALESQRPHYLIFNCGRPAGGSRMHKHMQAFEQDREELLPDLLLRDEGVRRSVPYKFKLEVLPRPVRDGRTEDAAQYLLKTYKEHVRWCREVLGEQITDGGVSHNIILTKRWLMTIPRREAGVGRATANAAGMMGLVWVSVDETVKLWKSLGPTNVLAQLGVPA